MKNLFENIEIECDFVYQNGGESSVFEYVSQQIKLGNERYKNVTYKACLMCETETPHNENNCLVCGCGY